MESWDEKGMEIWKIEPAVSLGGEVHMTWNHESSGDSHRGRNKTRYGARTRGHEEEPDSS